MLGKIVDGGGLYADASGELSLRRRQFEIIGPLIGPSNCHCSMCRKQHGAAFRSRARFQQSDFKWVQGEDLVTPYESLPGGYRGFCSVCSSPIINKFDAGPRLAGRNPNAPSLYGIALDTLDDDPGVRGGAHLCRSQGAVVRDHRQFTALRRILAARLEPLQIGERQPAIHTRLSAYS